MRYTFQEQAFHIAKVILAWVVAFLIMGFFRFYGATGANSSESIWANKPGDYIWQLVVAALITGLLYGIVDLIMDRPRYQRWSYWRVLLMKSALHFGIVVVIITLLLVILRPDGAAPIEFNLTWSEVLYNKSFQVFVVFFLVTSWILSAYQEVKRKFGKGVLLAMLLGRYHRPQEKDKIFMFVDLKSSVRLAEELGHIRYSYFLQDSYYDLNVVIDRYKAKIYQYVGDQAVLHWDLADGLKDANCIKCFYAFIERLDKNRDYYEKRYGRVPYFKAGAHAGRVTVAEVGVRKRSIAFHGDTVNTTSRIHDHCNEYQQRLLISKDLFDMLPDNVGLETQYIGDEVLKGKYHTMEILSVTGITL